MGQEQRRTSSQGHLPTRTLLAEKQRTITQFKYWKKGTAPLRTFYITVLHPSILKISQSTQHTLQNVHGIAANQFPILSTRTTGQTNQNPRTQD